MATVVGTEEKGVRRCVACIRMGGVLLYPTETVYGIGGLALDPLVAQRILAVKGSTVGKPMLALVDDWERAMPWFAELPPSLRRLMGYSPVLPFTVLTRAAKEIPSHLIGADGLVGVRRTSDPFCLALIAAVGCPLLSTSANRAGGDPPSLFADVDPLIVESVDLAVDAGRRLQGVPSTIVRFDGDELTIVREGAVLSATIHEIIGKA